MTISTFIPLALTMLPLSVLLGARIAAYIDNAAWAI